MADVTEQERHREERCSMRNSLPKELQRLELNQLNPGARSVVLHGCYGLEPAACAFSGHRKGNRLEVKQLGHQRAPIWDVSTSGNSLLCNCANPIVGHLVFFLVLILILQKLKFTILNALKLNENQGILKNIIQCKIIWNEYQVWLLLQGLVSWKVCEIQIYYFWAIAST